MVCPANILGYFRLVSLASTGALSVTVSTLDSHAGVRVAPQAAHHISAHRQVTSGSAEVRCPVLLSQRNHTSQKSLGEKRAVRRRPEMTVASVEARAFRPVKNRPNYVGL